MTRQIKFRAWEENGRNMISPEETGDHTINDLTEVMPYTLMQFTGLLDKNGKEIYEGDIVKRFVTNGWMIGLPVTYEDFCAGFMANGERMDKTYTYEIIGNIYEHPNLLTTDNTTKV